ncbi:MAG: YceI family protein [Chitinophagaceae bacterium]
MASINTNNEQRDVHLRIANFFEAEKHPNIIFKSTRIEKLDDEMFNIFGKSTIKETTNL